MPDSKEKLISVENVSKKFCKNLQKSLWYGVKDIAGEFALSRSVDKPADLRKAEFWALRDVSFDLKKGDALAVVGANGAGKSTLLKLLNGLIRPDAGRIVVRGKISAIIELGAGLDQNLTGLENIYLKAALFDIEKRKIKRLVDEIIHFAELENFVDSPVQFYSSGMKSRLSFAVTALLAPDVFLIDEVLAVGDIHFQRKCVNHTLKYLSDGGSLMLVSHNLYHIHSICKTGILLENGIVSFRGTAIETLEVYLERQKDKSVKSENAYPAQFNHRDAVVIKNAQIDSLNSEIIRSGDTVTVRMTVFSNENFTGVFWGFSILSGDSQACVTNCFSKKIDLREGSNDFSCTIRNFPLANGDYSLKLVLFEIASNQALAMKGWKDAPIRFSVESETSLFKNVALISKQLINLNVEWN